MEKYNEIQLTKNKMDLNNRKIKNHSPSRVSFEVNTHKLIDNGSLN